MIKKVTLSLVATMLAGMTLFASSAPALACDNNNLRGFNGNGNGRYFNSVAAQNYLYNNQFNNGFNGFNNGNNRAFKQARKMQHKQRQAARRLAQQQYAAVNGNPYYNNVNNPYYNNGYLNPGLANAYLNSNGACNNRGNGLLNGLYNNGLYNNGLYNNGAYGNGYGVSSLLGRVLNRL